MKRFLTRHIWFVTCLVLIVTGNAVALINACQNRQGEADSRITLTERELLYRISKENSNASLDILWRTPESDRYSKVLSADKLRELGLSQSLPEQLTGEEWGEFSFPEQLSYPVLLVLEQDGAAYQQELTRLQQELTRLREKLQQEQTSLEESKETKCVDTAQRKLDAETHCASRLFIVDAGRDREELRQRYPDRKRYTIINGSISPDYDYRSADKTYHLVTRVNEISISSLNVPRRWNALFSEAGVQPYYNYYTSFRYGNRSYPECRDENKLRYHVDLAYGQRLEPWIESITPDTTIPDK